MRAWHVVGTLAEARGIPAVGSVIISSIRRERRREGKMEAYTAFESKKVSGAPGV